MVSVLQLYNRQLYDLWRYSVSPKGPVHFCLNSHKTQSCTGNEIVNIDKYFKKVLYLPFLF